MVCASTSVVLGVGVSEVVVEGREDGSEDGLWLGPKLGEEDGASLGLPLGMSDAISLGVTLGCDEGGTLGKSEGMRLGDIEPLGA